MLVKAKTQLQAMSILTSRITAILHAILFCSVAHACRSACKPTGGAPREARFGSSLSAAGQS